MTDHSLKKQLRMRVRIVKMTNGAKNRVHWKKKSQQIDLYDEDSNKDEDVSPEEFSN